MREFLMLVFAAAVFIVTYQLLKRFWKGRAVRIYNKARKDGTTVIAECTKFWIRNIRTQTKTDDIRMATYTYEVNGKKYKKDMIFDGSSVVMYYDKFNPRRAVTKSFVNGADQMFARIVVSIIVMIVAVNVIF